MKDRNQLIKTMLEWFSDTKEVPNVKYIVSPHAGYYYSGSTAAYSFRSLPSTAKRVFVIGPDHIGVSTSGVAHISPFDGYETPLGNLSIDKGAVEELLHSSDLFSLGDKSEDMEEHCLELMMPFIAYRTELKAKIIPIIITHADLKVLKIVAENIKKIMKEDDFLVISSDFCHYGARFHFNPTFGKSRDDDVSKDIELMDKRAVEAMGKSTEALVSYFDETHNTICGHYPLILGSIMFPPSEYEPRIMMYSCSSPRLTPRDSGVCYCAVVGARR